MQQHDNPPIRCVTSVNGNRIVTQLTDCGHAGLLHVEIGAIAKPKLIHAKPGVSVTRAVMDLSDAEVSALFSVSPCIFSVPATMRNLANHFLIRHSDIQANLFTDEPSFVQWIATQPLANSYPCHQLAAEHLAQYELNPVHVDVMRHWYQFLEKLPEQQVFALATA